MDINEIQDELLRFEYPNLLPDHDPDIERYCRLRSLGYAADALVIYKNKLKPRYPSDEFRARLLHSYRSRNPVFNILIARAYRELGERSLERIKTFIFVIAEKVETLDEKDIYSTIKTAENILRLLPREKYEAIAGIERYHRYAETLKLKERSLAKASELVRAYLTESLAIAETERRRRRSEAETKAREQRRLAKDGYNSSLFQKKRGNTSLVDFSTVVFSRADLARIEIPAFTRIEDQVLAYMVKYWNLIYDAAFERVLFLYSRKFGKKNHDVYMIIRRGRIAGHSDDEILSALVSLLITGYYYSVQGDIYLQRNWKRIKNTMKEQLNISPQSAPYAAPLRTPAKRKTSGPKIIQKTRTKTIPQSAAQEPELKTAQPASSAQNAKTKTLPLKPKRQQKTPLARKEAAKPPRKTAPLPKRPKQAPRPEPLVQPPVVQPPGRQREFNTGLEKAKGSVSDRLKELSGHSYDVYQDRFLSKARGAIRKVMERGKGLFATLSEEAEDIVFGFLRDHYSDPYMNWEESAERKKLASLGYELPSLVPVIDECYGAL